jgi:chromosome segregation protein
MRIEKIRLIGFKSFSEKTSFNFYPGLTAIVGPNGCGKSNIVDAFKWVLGEQSAKSLRGDHMEDVIFSGSATKKPKGMADVTLVISGNNYGGSADEGQVSVTRRLYRSGESEYLINRVPCRLKDIKNMFLDTGLELKAYSILEQGRIDEILSSKPIDRRFLIEEVAGVMKYNIRKAEALGKLESSKANLQRLQDIINEVKRQINSISRFAKRAERYKQLFDEIKDIEIRLSVRDVSLMEEGLKQLTESSGSLASRETDISTRIHSSDATIEEKKRIYLEKEKELQGSHDRLNSAERDFIEEQGKISLIKSECENLNGRLLRLNKRDEELESIKASFSDQIQEVGHMDKTLSSELFDIEKAMDSKKDKLMILEREIEELEKNIEQKRHDIFEKTEEASSARNELNSLSLIRDNHGKRENKILEDIETLKNSISALDASIDDTKSEYHMIKTELDEMHAKKNKNSADLEKCKHDLSGIEEGLYKDRESLAAMSSRKESLNELDRKGKSAIKENIKIICQVADIFETRPEHETAIEAVLGDKLKASVVNDNLEIEKALSLIRNQKVGRSRFIPLNVSPTSRQSIPLKKGVIGIATDFVKVKEGFDNIASSLLNDVVIVNSLRTAFKLWQDYISVSAESPHLKYFVTPEGEVLDPSGIVSAGEEKGILKIKREIRELEKQTEIKTKDISLKENKVTALKDTIAELKNSISSLESKMALKDRSFHELNVKLTKMQEENIQENRRVEFLNAEMERDRKEKETAVKALEEKQARYGVLENERLSLDKEIKSLLKEGADRKTSLESLRSSLTEQVISRTAIKEKIDSMEREKERLNAEILENEKKKEQMSGEFLEIEEKIRQKEEEVARRQDALKSSAVSIANLKEESSRLKEILEAHDADLKLLEKQQKDHGDELTSVRKELSHLEVKRTELTLNISHIKENIRNIYSFELDSVTREDIDKNPLLPEEEEKLPALREKLQGIGPVNLGTLEELEELKTRYDFLTKQQGDLLQSIESLQETISKINRTTRKKLTEAFEALNEKFKEVFTILFGKGKAALILTDENILDAGIDIVAQPPGKKLQNLMLLSGGEKALTALSLLFAGFMIKPTPLCLLDEVDAPLDESNTDRFTSLLTELSKNIQFIIITHNRRTMEVVDNIYGVTMEEPGVSKIISMHLTEAV